MVCVGRKAQLLARRGRDIRAGKPSFQSRGVITARHRSRSSAARGTMNDNPTGPPTTATEEPSPRAAPGRAAGVQRGD